MRKIVSRASAVFVTLFGLISGIASLATMDPKKQLPFVYASILLLLGGVIWIFQAFIGFKTFIKIAIGARSIGIINIKGDRLHGGNEIDGRLKKAKKIDIFAVSGNQIVESYLSDIREALINNAAIVRIIFSTHDDYVKNENSMHTNNGEDIYSIIRSNCNSLQQCLSTSEREAAQDGRLGGEIQVGFFKSHNKLPLIICDGNYAAFHISLPPKESNESVLFELSLSKNSIGPKNKKLVTDFVNHFNHHWDFLTGKNLVGQIKDYGKLLSKIVSFSSGFDAAAVQHKLTEGARFNFNNKRDDRNLLLGADDKIVNHHFGIGFVEDIDSISDADISAELHRLELNQIEEILNLMVGAKSDHEVLDVGCGRGGTSIRISQKYNCKITGINIADYQVTFAREKVRELNLQNVTFSVMDFINPSFAIGKFDWIVFNEVTMYASDLGLLINNMRQFLKPGGTIVGATWCVTSEFNDEIWKSKINKHYDVQIHCVSEYERAFSSAINKDTLFDWTANAVDYFKLRNRWSRKSEIESAYLRGFETGQLKYYYFKASF